MRTQQVIAFLLGVIAALLAVLVFSDRGAEPTFADGALSGGGMVGVTANSEAGGRNILWLVDAKTDTPRLCLYEANAGRLQLLFARNIKYDFMYDEFPARNAQEPSVTEVFKETEAKKQQGRKEGGGAPEKPK